MKKLNEDDFDAVLLVSQLFFDEFGGDSFVLEGIHRWKGKEQAERNEIGTHGLSATQK